MAAARGRSAWSGLNLRAKLMKHRLFKRWKRNEEGVAAIEFSFIAPILLLLCVGMLDFGMVIYEKMRLENMAQAAADYLINGGSDDNLEDDVLNAYKSDSESAQEEQRGISVLDINIDLQCECSDGSSINCSLANTCGEAVEGGYRRRFYSVTVGKQYETFLPYGVIPQQIDLQGSARIQLD